MNGKTFILLLLSALAPCWGQQPLDAAAIVTLHAAGVSTAELDRLVTAHGVAKLDPAGIETLRKAGVGSALIARLESDLRAASPDPLDIEAIVALVDAGVKADQIIARIRQTNSTFDLKIDDIVDLAKRRVPGDVIKEMRSRGTTVGKITAAATTVTVEDVIDMSKAKMPSAEILRRIAKADAKFKLVVDDLLDLSRKGVAHDVLKALSPGWRRRLGGFRYCAQHLFGFTSRVRAHLEQVDRERGRIPDEEACLAADRAIERREQRFQGPRIARVLLPWYSPHPRSMPIPTRRALASYEA